MNFTIALRHRPGLVLALVGTAVVGCRTRQEGAEPLALPPASTFVIDFSDFQDAGGNQKQLNWDPTAAQLGFDHWGYSALNVGIWNTIITVGLTVPVAAFYESFNHDPALQDDGTWIWSYNFYVAGIRHTAELHGIVMGNNVEWDMYISREGEYEDFNWYSGVSTLTRTEGTWTLYKNPDEPIEFIDIEWHNDPETDTGDIRYTNVEPEAASNGSYISYAVSDDDTYDAAYDIFNAETDEMVEIERHSTSLNGRVRAAGHFGDDEWHCWDQQLQNLECPQ